MTHQRRRPLRLIAALLAGALGLSASPLVGMAGAADPLPPLANPIAAGAFCDGAPSENPFTDLGGESQPTRDTIICLVATGLTQGTTPTTYTPGGTVTRRQMSLFIKRLADLFNEQETQPLTDLPAYDNIPDYPDVLPTDNGAEAIGQLTQADIVGGFPDGTFRPNAPVSRRQMAAFVNRLQDFLTGTPYSTTGNFFDDDEGDSGEANLNALASVGIFQGDGQGNVFPGANLTRRQMANILLRDAQVFFADDLIDSPFAAPPPATNQSFAVTPVEAASQTRVASPEVPANTTDDRAYTVGGLDSTESYVVALFSGADVQTDSNGIVTFDDALGDNIADRTAPTADITVANGAPQVPNTSLVTVAPVSGTITFTVDGDTANETVVPVVWLDSVTGGTGVLNLTVPATANNSPKTPAEDFGVGGSVTYSPPAATTGSTGPPDVAITGVDKTANTITTANLLYSYDTNDTFYVRTTDTNDLTATAGAPAEQVTLDGFEAVLSAGDQLDASTFYQATAALPSTFVLENLSPAAPILAVTDPSTSTSGYSISVTGVVTGATVEVLQAVEDGGGSSATTTPEFAATPASFAVVATITSADDTGAAPGIQYTVSVTPSTTAARDFSVIVRQLSGGETSGVSNEVNDVTVPVVTETVAPTVTNTAIVLDTAPAGLLTPGDTFVMDFSEAMAATAGTQASSFVRVADSDSVYSLTGPFVLSDGPSSTGINDRLLVDVAVADLVAPVSGTPNGLDVAGDTVTVTLVSADLDDANGNPVNLPGSADLIVNDEGVVDAAGPTITTATFTNGAGVAADFDNVADTLTLVFDEALDTIVAGDDVTVGGVTLNCGTEVTCVLSAGNTTLALTWAAAGGTVTAIVGKAVTAASGITDAAGNGADGFPETVV